MLKTGIFYNLIDRDIKPGQTFTTFGSFLEYLNFCFCVQDFQLKNLEA